MPYSRNMMFPPLFRLLLLAVALLAGPAAALTGENAEHARSAMQFAQRKDWNNAILHARASHDAALLKLMRWQSYLTSDSGADFNEIAAFIKENPGWPEQKRLKIRAEKAIRTSAVPDSVLMDWFGGNMPITGTGKLALAEAILHAKGPKEKAVYLIRDAWRNGDFDELEEARLTQAYGNMLTREDEVTRIDRLLWDGKTAAAKRVMNRVPADYQKLFNARIAYMEDKKTALLYLAQVPSSLKSDMGLLYERVRYRARREDNEGVRELLLAAAPHVPYPEKWWRFREYQIRAAVDEKNYAMARKLLAGHGQVSGQEFADASWLQGWIECEFAGKPKEAYDIFYKMFDNVKFPVSRARAAYWASVAAAKAGDAEAAKSWLNTASAYPTTFYGQVASLKLNGTAPLRLSANPGVTAEDKQAFAGNDLARAAELCAQLGETDLANKLIAHLVDEADTPGQALLASEIGKRNGRMHLSVRGAKRALQNDMVLLSTGYPSPALPSGLAVEPALALSITRQESEFDPQAKSPSGALGMMQLLPGTAKETAKRNDIPYAVTRLYEPAYNENLGSLYLGKLINSYSGSYVMGIAAYNAGPGNVRNWSQQFGTPGKSVESAIMWIEKIPFNETRNYVQRVLENLQVYRHLSAEKTTPKLAIGDDLVR